MAGFDRIGKDTGPGKFDTLLTPEGSKIVCSFLLFNFNIDGNVLKPEHKRILDKQIVPLLKEHRLHARLTGTASQSGASEYNRQLSISRVLRVKEYLVGKSLPESKVPGTAMQALGEDHSTSPLQEDERDRAVRVEIALGIKPLPIFPNIVIPMIITAEGPPQITVPRIIIKGEDPREKWTIRQIHGHNVQGSLGISIPGVGAGVGLGMVEYHFVLVNQKTAQMAQCRFFGPGGSAGVGPAGGKPGISPSVGMSATMPSRKWNDFTSKPGADFGDFNGSATWHEPAGLALGTNVGVPATLELHRLGLTVAVETGKAIGFPSSAVSLGHFRCKQPIQLKR